MSDIAKLEAMYAKETELYHTHKEKADRLKQKIEEEKGQAILKSVKNLNLSPDEFKRFQKALSDEGNIRKLIQEAQEIQEPRGKETNEIREPHEIQETNEQTGGEFTDGAGNETGASKEAD